MKLFEAANRELDKHSYLARGGQMVDASIVSAPRQHFRKGEKALVKEEALPIDWSPAKRRQKDIDATWTKKHGKPCFGYKLSANADKQYKLVRKVKTGTASEHDTLHLEGILDTGNTRQDLHADKGHVDGGREKRLKATGLRVHIQRKAPKGNKPLSDCQKRRNIRIAKTRARIEHVFASLEQMGGKGLRCIAPERATLQLNFKAATYNLRRLCSLKTCGINPAFAF